MFEKARFLAEERGEFYGPRWSYAPVGVFEAGITPTFLWHASRRPYAPVRRSDSGCASTTPGSCNAIAASCAVLRGWLLSTPVSDPTCFLAPFSKRPCEGQLRKVHLLEKQALRRRGHDPWDLRSYVLACGGPWPGLSAHHGEFDAFKLRVPAKALPETLIELAEEIGMVPYLERRYGYVRAAA